MANGTTRINYHSLQRSKKRMQTAHHLTLNNGQNMPYLLYLPDDYEVDTKRVWPFILFLHGSGERGHDLELVRKFGVPKQIDTQSNFPCIVLPPHCPVDVGGPEEADNLMALWDTLLHQLRVDLSRFYLTGLS